MSTVRTKPARDWGRLLLWPSLLAGGVVAAALTTRAMQLRRAVRRLLDEPPTHSPSPRAMALLCRAIAGNDKQSIAALLGPPRTALHRGRPGTRAGAEPFHAADTWYYPLDRREQTAVVIAFREGVACDAQLLRAPRRSSPAAS